MHVWRAPPVALSALLITHTCSLCARLSDIMEAVSERVNGKLFSFTTSLQHESLKLSNSEANVTLTFFSLFSHLHPVALTSYQSCPQILYLVLRKSCRSAYKSIGFTNGCRFGKYTILMPGADMFSTYNRTHAHQHLFYVGWITTSGQISWCGQSKNGAFYIGRIHQNILLHKILYFKDIPPLDKN